MTKPFEDRSEKYEAIITSLLEMCAETRQVSLDLLANPEFSDCFDEVNADLVRLARFEREIQPLFGNMF